MVRASLRLGIVLMTVAAVGCATQPAAPAGPSEADMVASANALDEAFVAALNSGDVAAMNALYWNDPAVVSFQPDNLVVRGFAGVSEANAAMVTGMQGVQLRIDETHQIPVGDAVVGWGLFTLTMPAADGGQATEISGRYTDLKAERDGKWVYLLDHASVPLPAAAPPTTN